MPFVPIEMMLEYGCHHEYYFDLESLFYVLVWICLLEDGPRWEGHYPSSKYVMKGSILERWCGGPGMPADSNKDAYQSAGDSKSATVLNETRFNERILAHLPKYFEPIKELLEELRTILFRPKLDLFCPENIEDYRPICQRKNKDRVFRRYIDALRRVCDELPFDDFPYGAPASKAAKAVSTESLERNQMNPGKGKLNGNDAGEGGGYANNPDLAGHTSLSPTKGRAKQSTGASTACSQSRKRSAPWPESIQASKRRRTTSVGPLVERSHS